jgi:tRNA threonylcarbamoyl adenosine modification protein (Sua5/YciO/YrdC/YwlC family)
VISTEILKINPLNPEKDKIKYAAEVLRGGGLVAFPTETVYGLGANLWNKKAIDRLYEVKKRHKDKPFSIHIANPNKVKDFAFNIPALAYRLIEKFWPGPLTIILESKDDKVGIRMPRNLIALRLIEESGVPVVAPSANLSGNPPPKMAEDVLRDLNGLIEMVLDGGKTEIGIESTVVDLTVSPAKILREGAISAGEIKMSAESKTILFVCTGNSCRSVMAKALLEKEARDKGKDLKVIAGGVGAMPGMGASKQTQELLTAEGIDVSAHKAQTLTPDMIKEADLIFVMEQFHKGIVLEKVLEAKDKVYLLGDFVETKKSGIVDILDPIGKPMEVYQEVFRNIKEAIEGVMRFI